MAPVALARQLDLAQLDSPARGSGRCHSRATSDRSIRLLVRGSCFVNVFLRREEQKPLAVSGQRGRCDSSAMFCHKAARPLEYGVMAELSAVPDSDAELL